MGKKRATKDRGYITSKEHKEEWGGYKERKAAPFQRLPFHCCAITFTPFEDPVCTEDGTVFDIMNIVPYVKKYGRHPVSGTPLSLGDLIPLNFHKNADGEYACPVTGKVFTPHTHIAALRTSGNVFSYDALQELCIKPKSWKDLLTDEPFTRKDIIHIQDPLNAAGRLIAEFHHVKHDLAAAEEEAGEETGSSLRNVNQDLQRALGALGTAEAADAFRAGGGGKRAEAKQLLAEAALQKQKAAASASGNGSAAATAATGDGAPKQQQQQGGSTTNASGKDWRLVAPARKQMPDFKPGAVTWDTDDYMNPDAAAGGASRGKKKSGGVGAGRAADAAPQAAADDGRPNPKAWYDQHHAKYESSVYTTGASARAFTSTIAETSTRSERQLKLVERRPGRKAYLRLHTSLGDLNLELHADIAPRTCENFIYLAEMGYYNGTIFHRSIKNFMIQGGDPTGTGMGGESIYGPTFRDELDSRLLHNGRGVLSMANSGPNSNGSQFFILYKSAPHLNHKHSVFGRVVGGLDVLGLMERVVTDDEDRPLQEISITGATIFTNPFKDMEDEEAAAAAAEAKKAAGNDPGDADQERGNWFSNPGAANAPAQVRAGVGKYIAAPTLGSDGAQPAGSGGTAAAAAAAAGSRAANDAEAGVAAAPPPAKKPRAEQQQQTLANFDAW